MPKVQQNITIPFNITTGAYDLAQTDYQNLLNSLVLSLNPDGITVVQISLTGTVYNAAAIAAQDQIELTALQAKLTQDTAAEQDINP